MRVNFHNPELPDDVEVDIGGLLLVNNQSVDVDEEQQSEFEARNGKTIEEAMTRVQFVKVGGKHTYEEIEPNEALDVPASLSEDAGEGE